MLVNGALDLFTGAIGIAWGIHIKMRSQGSMVSNTNIIIETNLLIEVTVIWRS